jgi:hypothetical protein
MVSFLHVFLTKTLYIFPLSRPCHMPHPSHVLYLIDGIIFLQYPLKFSWKHSTFPSHINTVGPGYNDVGLYDIPSITTAILWYQLIPHC